MKEREHHDTDAKLSRRPYAAPSILRVELRPEEAVLGFCKNDASGGGPNGTKCKSVTACSTQGS
jgi:hypothetical protein